MRGSNGRYPPIESHAIIGDLQTAALVTLDGTIDFLCLPHFDSPSVFASLLDADKGGCFAITPDLDQPRHKQLYLPDTNLLLTRFLAPEGVAEISDFMPVHPREHTSRVVRRVKTVRGEIRYPGAVRTPLRLRPRGRTRPSPRSTASCSPARTARFCG